MYISALDNQNSGNSEINKILENLDKRANIPDCLKVSCIYEHIN
jgi:hypothetical protein